MKELVADIKRLNHVSVLASVVVAAGIVLWMFASKIFVIVIAIGAFGPGMLRELGWIDDHDEYQRQTAHRAGYHAYLFAGFLLAVFGSVLAVEGQSTEASELVNFLLVASWAAWMFSSLLQFWGARKTTSRFLIVFGSFWTLFVLAHFVGGESNPDTPLWESLLGVAFGLTLIALFFVPAWAAHRWPQVTGWVLIAAGLGLTAFLSIGNNLPLMTRLTTNTMLMVPMIVCGVALISEVRSDQDEDREVAVVGR